MRPPERPWPRASIPAKNRRSGLAVRRSVQLEAVAFGVEDLEGRELGPHADLAPEALSPFVQGRPAGHPHPEVLFR